jgi:RNA polymerase sigma factor (sigma-70 family)
MADQQLALVLRHLRTLVDAGTASERTDPQLLEQFVARRDQAAFATLVQRHGPMVLGVCRGWLRDRHDAEDAFQATFLVLVRRAASLDRHKSLGGWLHNVACRVARKAAAQAAKRGAHERQAPPMPSTDPLAEVAARDLHAVLHEELRGLPDQYRVPLVLCYFEGRTHAQAAQELGTPPGSMAYQLARARDLLLKRLSRRGVTLPAGGLAVVLTAQAASAVPPVLLDATVRGALLAAAGQAAAGFASPRAADLADQAVRAMLVTRLTGAAAWLLAVSLAAAGAGLFIDRLVPSPPAADAPAAAGAELRSARAEGVRAGEKPVPADRFGDPLPPDALARLGTVRFRVGHRVKALAFSPDGRMLTAGGDETIPLWEAATGKEVRRLAGHEGWAGPVAFSPDGRTLASGGADRVIRLWDLATGRELRRLLGHRNVISGLVFSPDGRTVVSGSTDETVRIWDAASGRQLRQIGRLSEHAQPLVPTPIAFLPDNQRFATRDLHVRTPDSTLRLWDAATGREFRRLDRLPRGLAAVAFSPSGTTLATAGGRDGAVRLWQVATGRELRRLDAPGGAAHALAFAPDGKTLAAAAGGRGGSSITIHLWEVATGKGLRRLDTRLRQSGGLAYSADGALAFSPDGTRLAWGHDTTLLLWEVATGAELHPHGGHRGPVRSVAYAPDGRALATGGNDGTVRLWDPASGAERARSGGHAGAVGCVALAPDGGVLASAGSQDGAILLRHPRTLAVLRALRGHQGGVTSLAFAPEGRSLVSAGYDGTVRLWDVSTGRQRRRFEGHRAEVWCVAFSPDGRLVASGGMDGELRLWQVATGKPWRTFGADLGWVRSLAFSPDGQTLACVSQTARQAHDSRGGRGGITLWEVATGRERRRWPGHGRGAYCVAFSPDGRVLASGGADRTVRLWEPATGQELGRRGGQLGTGLCLAFAPDGKAVAAGSTDTTTLVWDVAGLLPAGRP